MMKKSCLLLPLLLISFFLQAQEKAAVLPEQDSPEALITAMYKLISGPAGERNWDKLRAYCKPEVQFNVLSQKDGSSVYRSLSLDEYIATAGKHFLANDFYEEPLGYTIQRFGPIAQVFSAYSSSKSPGGEAFDRGVNSYQLVKEGGRWWIVNILWTSETEENPLPAELIQP